MTKSKRKAVVDTLKPARDSLDDDEFIEPNEFVRNEVINDQEHEADGFEKDNELIDKLRSLDGRKTKRLRTEIVNNELDVSISTRNDPNSVHKIKTFEILNALRKTDSKAAGESGELLKMFAKTYKRNKVLETPLPKHITEKAQRIASYQEEKKEVSQWDPVVKKNRQAEQLVFPLKQPNYSMQTASNLSKVWKPETDLEKRISELLNTSENNLKDQNVLTQAELKAIESMNLEELKQKRAEFMKLKALQSYQEQKFKRLKNIKSKRYRKILRKEREKNEEKELAKLEKEDPAKFREVLEQMEKKRMMERMSLKHKNTSKWAKQQNIYAKYSDRAREQVQEQLDLSKKLTQKLAVAKPDEDQEQNEQDDDRDGIDNENIIENLGLDKTSNPWLKMMSGIEATSGKGASDKSKAEQKSEFGKPMAFVDQKAIEADKAQLEEESSDDSGDEGFHDKKDENLKEVAQVFDNKKESDESEEDEDDATEETQRVETKAAPSNKSQKNLKKKQAKETKKANNAKATKVKEPAPESEKKEKSPADIAIKPTPKLDLSKAKKKSKLDDFDHQVTLNEAFADDDVIAEFKAEKKAIIEEERVKPIDLSMPGWGGWAGAGIDMKLIKTKRKKYNRKNRNEKYVKKLVIKPEDVIKTEEEKQQLERKDKDLSHVIISEKKDTKIATYQISELPHQFKSVVAFENSIAQPVGRTWNPDQKFRKLTTPRVKTKMGTIIEPIDKDDIVRDIKKGNKK